MANKIFPRFDEPDDFTIIKISMDDEDRARGLEHINDVGSRAFRAVHPEFPFSDENASRMEAWLLDHGDLPATRHNLEIAYRDLQEDGLLVAVPPPAAPEVDTSRGIVEVRADVMYEYQPSASEAAVLTKLADDPNLSDAARKSRLRKLAVLAGEQRRELASANLYR